MVCNISVSYNSPLVTQGGLTWDTTGAPGDSVDLESCLRLVEDLQDFLRLDLLCLLQGLGQGAPHLHLMDVELIRSFFFLREGNGCLVLTVQGVVQPPSLGQSPRPCPRGIGFIGVAFNRWSLLTHL